MIEIQSEDSLFIGRKTEINTLLGSLNKKRSVTLVTGEAGVGKSFLLKEFYRTLQDNAQAKYLVGFYDESKEVRTAKAIHPFIIALESLLQWEADTEKFDYRLRETLKRMESAFLKFGKTKGKEILGAIIQDIAEKAGFKETFKLGKEIFKAVDAEKSTRMLASSYVDENKDDIVYSYINILKAIAEEFTDRILS